MAQSISPPFDPPPELRSADKWTAFKALWREVGAVKPSRPGIVPPEGRQFAALNAKSARATWPELPDYDKRAYYLSLDGEQALRLNASLFRIFDLPDTNSSEYDISIEKALSEKNASVEAKMLARLLQLRIQQMSMPTYKTSDCKVTVDRLSRAAPPISLISHLVDVPPSHYMVGAIDRIEARIDALTDLRAKGAISESVFASALAAIQSDAKLVLHLDALSNTQGNRLTRDGFADRFSLFGWFACSVLPWIEKEDFTEPQGQVRAEDVDLRNYQTWEHAAEASFRRSPRSDWVFWGNARHSDRAKRRDINKEQADEEAVKLKQRLSRLRETYPRLEALLAELER